MSIRIMTAKEAVKLVESNRTLCTEGFVGAALAEELLLELQNRYRETGSPRDLTLIYAAGQGDGEDVYKRQTYYRAFESALSVFRVNLS